MNNEKLNTTDWETCPERIRIYHESSTNSFDWGDANCAGDSDEVEYTRDDTIPSRVQVAREFVNALTAHKKHTQSRNWTEAISVVLKEWEAAGEKNA